ncbi:MAG: hypothetical protein AAF197_09750 [Pseudomonadota bacterium]
MSQDNQDRPSDRRKFVKTVAVGASSITFSRLISDVQAQGEIVPTISLLLDDSEESSDIVAELGVTLEVLPLEENAPQRIIVPDGANFMNFEVEGSGGSGARSASDSSGRGGGDGANISDANVPIGNIDEMIVHVGEGGVAAEASEPGRAGEFGGGTGGTTAYAGITSFELAGSTENSHGEDAAPGGHGGGYSAIMIDGEIAVVAGGGAGGGFPLEEGQGSQGGNADAEAQRGDGFVLSAGDTNEGSDAGNGAKDGTDGTAAVNNAPFGESSESISGEGFAGETILSVGGNGGDNLSIGERSGGAGGGGGGGWSDGGDQSGGGGGAEGGDESGPGAGGAGGNGGISFQNTNYSQEGDFEASISLVPESGGSGGSGAETAVTYAESGQSGKVRITFLATEV